MAFSKLFKLPTNQFVHLENIVQMIFPDFIKDICIKTPARYPQHRRLKLNKLYLISCFDMEDKIIFWKTMFDQTLGLQQLLHVLQGQ